MISPYLSYALRTISSSLNHTYRERFGTDAQHAHIHAHNGSVGNRANLLEY